MRHTQPIVRLIARPQIDWAQVKSYLDDVGGQEWNDRMFDEQPPDGEALVEFGGRMCYRSWTEGLNPNVTKVRRDRLDYLRNVIKSGHGSVLEHANYTFLFQDVSRVFTHELVRHRAGTAISQESLRYVRLTDLPFAIPEFVTEDPELHAAAIDLLARMEAFQILCAEATGIDEMKDFHVKKEITSAMRRFAPIGLSTSIMWTANLRTLRHVIEARTSYGAETEIRYVFDKVVKIMKEEAPLIFDDIVLNEEGEWFPTLRSKV